jgi:hypothetical protein
MHGMQAEVHGLACETISKQDASTCGPNRYAIEVVSIGEWTLYIKGIL